MHLLGSHVGMSGKEMMLGSVKEALSYGANTFMLYTGAPQNTRRKQIDELNIEAAKQCMEENGISTFVVHAPYIINLANTVKPETFEIGVEFLELEMIRTAAMGSKILVLHPGAHVGAGVEAGTARIIQGLDMVMEKLAERAESSELSGKTAGGADVKIAGATDVKIAGAIDVKIALETMAGKGSEIGRTFEELKAIYDGVKHPENLRVCFDTCHVSDAGYDIVNDYEGVLAHFDEVLGLDQIAVIHVNDSKNPLGAHKDRHENLGKGCIGFETLHQIVSDPRFAGVPKILETPWIKTEDKPVPPYREEIACLQAGKMPE